MRLPSTSALRPVVPRSSTITNTGTEPLTGVTVTDQVVGNGTVTGLNCTFPDGTTGTVYSGCSPWPRRSSARRPFRASSPGPSTIRTPGSSPEPVRRRKAGLRPERLLGEVTKAASVSVGDFVWTDADHNGVQDTGEPGISGVHLSITRTDGPALNADGSTPRTRSPTPRGLYCSRTWRSSPPACSTRSPSTRRQSRGPVPDPHRSGHSRDGLLDGVRPSTDLTADGASDPTLDPWILEARARRSSSSRRTRRQRRRHRSDRGSSVRLPRVRRALVYTITNTGTEP